MPLPSERGFSLIELVVVLAITATLATLAIPAMRSFMDKGNAGRCAANLKQLASIATTYAAEHGYYPPIRCLDGSSPPSTQAGFPVFYYLASPHSCATCPGAAHRGKNNTHTKQLIHQNAYAANPKVLIGNSPNASKVKPFMITRPSEVVLLADGSQWKQAGTFWTVWPYIVNPAGTQMGSAASAEQPLEYGSGPHGVYSVIPNGEGPSINFRHNGRANVVFCDGHVASITNVSDLKQKNLYWNY
jgi:prepilin-type processing-associated H-X9-DG protein/prepilin-type N-terminal cleavage/methylation domain-containing protein